MASQDWLDKDFYAILGVSSDADAATIKKTYRKLARKLHPDQNAGDTAAEAKFKEIGEAYSVLSDPEQRQQYDQLRAMTRGGARFTSGGGGSPGGFEDLFSGMFSGGNTRTRYSTSNSSANDPDMQDLLASLFGQAGGSYPGGSTYGGYDTFGAPRGPRKGADVQARTTLSFRDAVAGQTVTLEAADGQRITTRIPPGVRDGQKIRLRGKGARGDGGAEPGDLMLTVTVEKHPVCRRRRGQARPRRCDFRLYQDHLSVRRRCHQAERLPRRLHSFRGRRRYCPFAHGRPDGHGLRRYPSSRPRRPAHECRRRRRGHSRRPRLPCVQGKGLAVCRSRRSYLADDAHRDRPPESQE